MPHQRISDGKIMSGTLSPLPANVVRGLTPTIGAWNYAKIGKAFADDGGVFTDETTDANSAAANDVALLPAAEAIGDKFYFGDETAKFSAIRINLGTVGIGNTIVWEYWNGAWVSLTVADFTNGFTTAGTNDVNLVDDTEIAAWTTTAINGVTAYWVRARCTVAAFTQQPLATQIWLYSEPIAYMTSIANITDGDVTTASISSKATTGTNDNYGWFFFDRGAGNTSPLWVAVQYSWMIEPGGVSSTLSFFIESSNVNTFVDTEQDSGVGYLAATAALGEMRIASIPCLVVGRYFRLRFRAATATTVYTKIYEVLGYELGT